ncbi:MULTISPECIES: DUF7504 family protein [Halorussus]|uniref:DUF7504 family protein n=1 Tax=Halorussus TaxID=1070314 RepID=UPI00209E59AA|nr:hypothetical protein [Halorussus vallis]USZ77905.1 hypothetical protein NGM07_22255 [Halorussus vallis]
MVSHDEGSGLTDTERQRFVSTLQNLKQNGSSLLVVGSVPDSAATQACHRMLGDVTARDRRRLFVSTDPALPTVTDRLSASHERLRSDRTTLVTWTAKSRSAATASPSHQSSDGIPTVSVESDRLADLGIAISREIEAFEEIAVELAPSELRVCFDSLSALVADYEREEVFRFLHVLVGRIRSVQAMAHFHLPVDYDSELVAQFAPLFDAIIELRIVDDRAQQRWHLRDENITSQWLTPSTV